MKSFTPVKKVLVYLHALRVVLCCCLLFCTTAMAWSQSLSESSLASAASADQLAGVTAAVKVEHQALGNTTSVNNKITKPLTVGFSQHPSDAGICTGSNTSFSVVATGNGILTYQWELSTNGGSTWNNVAGAVYSGINTATLSITGAPNTMNGFLYRCVVTDVDGSNTSNQAMLSVGDVPTVQTTNTDLEVCPNGAINANAIVIGGQPTTYQWQLSTDNGVTWNDLADGGIYSGTATSSLAISSVPVSMQGYLYRYRATNAGACTATSTGHYVQKVLVTNISQQPASFSACVGSPVTLPAAASTNANSLIYQWQVSTNGGFSWGNASNGLIYSNATTNTLGINVTGSMNNNYRFRLFIRTVPLFCQTFTNAAALTVLTATASGAPANITACANEDATFSVSATGSNLSYQWQTDNGTGGSTWSDVGGPTTSSSLTLSSVPITMNGYQYRVIVTGDCGSPVTTAAGTLTVVRHGTWLGVVDTNWHVAGNWCGGVPTSTTDVLIPNGAPNMPTISDNTGTAFFQSIEIENTARLTINGGAVDAGAMAGTFDIDGTVAYTALVDQPVFPADHGSLEVGGDGNKIMQSDAGIFNNLVLGGAAKLVTGTRILTMYNGSNPISGAAFGPATSWIVTGNGAAGAANTGLGGLRIEQVNAADGTVLYPIGPTSAAYNPIQISNTGTIDDITIAVNDQVIPGGLFASGIDRTWLVSEASPGGSNLALEMLWDGGVEQADFDRTITEVIRSDGSSIVENSATAAASGTDPYSRGASSFTSLTQFSVASYVAILPVKLLSFQVQKVSATAALTWKTDARHIAEVYIIEKSTDGSYFNAIGQLPGEPGKMVYRFTDHNLGNGETWYRIKMTGKGGEIVYSRIVSVNSADVAGNHFELRPTVTREGQVQVLMQLQRQESVTLRLTDVLGREQLRQAVQFDKGSYRVPVNVSQLAKGVYYLHIRTASGETTVLPLIKQ